MSILVVMEQRGGAWNRMSFETLAAAQQLAAELNTTASAVVLGQGTETLAAELSGKQLARLYLVEHELLKEYTPDAYTAALRQQLAERHMTTCCCRTPIRSAIFYPNWRRHWALWR